MPNDTLETPPNDPQDTPIEPTPQIPAWQAALYAANQEKLRLQAEVERLKGQQPSPKQPDSIELVEGDAFKDPTKFKAALMADVNATVAPINAFIAGQQREKAYNRLKLQFKSGLNADGIASFARIEGMVDAQFLDNDSLRIDGPTFQTVIQNVVGGLYLSGAFSRNDTPTPPNNPPKVNDMQPPPNIPPRTPQITKPTQINLDENERRLAREQGLSPEEFVIMRDTPPDQIEKVWSEILEKRKGGKK